MPDNLTKEERRKNMQNIRSKDTLIELLIASKLRKKRLSFLRNVSSIKGKPDFVFTRRQVVVFLDSCFWHVCPYHSNIPKTRKGYWVRKLQRNKERDKQINKLLKKEGWKIIRIWEHQINSDADECVKKIINALRLTR